MQYVYTSLASPLGRLRLVAGDQGLAAVLWEHQDGSAQRFGAMAEAAGHPVLVHAQQQLADYFAGTRRSFSVPLAVAGTEFQQRVWTALRTIPFGQTRSYGQIAAQIGRDKAGRAVGAANGRNPIPIIVPCHRVIGADGTLTGFTGGVAIKAQLLALERRSVSPPGAQLGLGV